MFAGIAIGDLLGMPVESYTSQRIAEIYPKGISGYVEPVNHKYYSSIQITDDTQLSVAVAQAIMESKGFDMISQTKYHVNAFRESVTGWGTSSREAVRRLANGVNWYMSGVTASEDHIGLGNGITMKIAPLAAYATKRYEPDLHQKIIDFGAMTHNSKNACIAGLIHFRVLYHLLNCKEEKLSPKKDCIDHAVAVIEWGDKDFVNDTVFYSTDRLKDFNPTIEDAFYRLLSVFENKIAWENVKKEFGYGSCPVHNSLPFTYAYFFKSPTIQGLYDLVNAGGDTDSNASMFGAMLGAWKGMSVWTPELLNRPDVKGMVNLADEFCNAIGV